MKSSWEKTQTAQRAVNSRKLHPQLKLVNYTLGRIYLAQADIQTGGTR